MVLNWPENRSHAHRRSWPCRRSPWLRGAAAATPRTTRGKVRVAAAFYPLQYVAQRVGGDLVDVTNLTQPGRRAARPRARRSSRPPRRRGRRRGLRARLPAGGRRRGRPERRGRRARRRRRRATSSPSPTRPTRPTRTSGRTRCGWPTSPTRSRPRSATADPDHAATYDANAAAPASRPRPPSTTPTPTGLADCERHTIVVSHDAFGYLGQVRPATSSRSPASPPTPSRRPPTWPGCRT